MSKKKLKKRYHLFVSHGYEDGGFQYRNSFVELSETEPHIQDKSVEDAEIFENDTDGALICTYWLDNALSEYGLTIPVKVWRKHETKEAVTNG